MTALTLVSHSLCPYVQRAAIILAEKRVAFERRDVDLANKPDWFTRISPLGRVPLLMVANDDRPPVVLFESAVIVEYLDETHGSSFLPGDPLGRARHRAWIAFASEMLDGIGRFYSAADRDGLARETDRLEQMFARLEQPLGDGPWFAGDHFGLVDAAFGPVFRYFDVFDQIADFGILDGKERVAGWRERLAARPSVAAAAASDYPERLRAFLAGKGSAISDLVAEPA